MKGLYKQIACAILAGGQSSRYGGYPKGNLRRPDGKTILSHLADEVRASGIGDIVLVANNPDAYSAAGLEITPDLRRGSGPLAGIEAALDRFRNHAGVLLLPCDLPSLTHHEIGRLLTAFRSNGNRLVAARTASSFWHPLCSVVQNALRDTVKASLDQGRLSVHRLWEEAAALPVDFADAAPFANVNTPSEWNALREAAPPAGSLKICASERWRLALAEWACREGVTLELGREDESGIRVEEPEGRQPSDLETLRVGGWMSCELGHVLADRLRVPPGKVCGLLNVLDIRVRKCKLGCF